MTIENILRDDTGWDRHDKVSIDLCLKQVFRFGTAPNSQGTCKKLSIMICVKFCAVLSFLPAVCVGISNLIVSRSGSSILNLIPLF